jgi:hypothetical protein
MGRIKDKRNYLMEKLVHFSKEEAKIQEIPTLDEFTDDEYADSYYSPAEYLRLRKRERQLLRRLKMVGDVGTEDDTLGLESESENREKHVFIECAQKSVFSEQERQFETEEHDPERLAKLYSRASEESCDRANLRAVSIHSQLSNNRGHPRGRRMSMSMIQTAAAPSTFTDSFEPAHQVRRGNMAAGNKMPEQALQSPCPHRWSQSGVREKVESAGLGLPKRTSRTPQQCSRRKNFELSHFPQSIITPAL